MAPALLLIPSPFLGPTTWTSTARALEDSGRRVRVPSMRAVAESDPPYWPAGVDAIVRAAADEPVVDGLLAPRTSWWEEDDIAPLYRALC